MAVGAAKPIDELTYGTVLYDYFQQDYQSGLLGIAVGESQGRLGEDTVRFELARGSFAFADGMYDYARTTFDAVPTEELTDIDRMRLAFHLAREYHRRGDWQMLDAEIAKIDLGKTWRGRVKSHPEVEYMRAEAAISRGDFDAAHATLSTLDPRDQHRAYGLFNLGVAYRDAGAPEQAYDTFAELAAMDAFDEETFDLTQRARLAMAYLNRAANKKMDAATLLGELPSDGRYQDVALASYGNLAMASGDYELAARDLDDPANPAVLDLEHGGGAHRLSGEPREARLDRACARAVPRCGEHLRVPTNGT